MKAVNKYEDGVHGGLYDTPADALTAERSDVAMTKKIVVDCCRQCCLKEPVYSETLSECFKCAHAATEGHLIMNTDILPDWCMLEDN
jgi:sulfur relay (sulfurtransferase) complex TusBCD TusD component (DsrE family)